MEECGTCQDSALQAEVQPDHEYVLHSEIVNKFLL